MLILKGYFDQTNIATGPAIGQMNFEYCDSVLQNLSCPIYFRVSILIILTMYTIGWSNLNERC